MRLSIAKAADTLLGGGLIAYPTEGVYGLGCMPDDDAAVLRLLTLKGRDPGKGLIVIAADKRQLDDWIIPDGSCIPTRMFRIRSPGLRPRNPGCRRWCAAIMPVSPSG